MQILDIILINGRWTINGKSFSQCNKTEKLYANQFFKLKKLKPLKL